MIKAIGFSADLDLLLRHSPPPSVRLDLHQPLSISWLGLKATICSFVLFMVILHHQWLSRFKPIAPHLLHGDVEVGFHVLLITSVDVVDGVVVVVLRIVNSVAKMATTPTDAHVLHPMLHRRSPPMTIWLVHFLLNVTSHHPDLIGMWIREPRIT